MILKEETRKKIEAAEKMNIDDLISEIKITSQELVYEMRDLERKCVDDKKYMFSSLRRTRVLGIYLEKLNTNFRIQSLLYEKRNSKDKKRRRKKKQPV